MESKSSMLLSVLVSCGLLVAVSAQPEYSTPGGILSPAGCYTGCTQVEVHEANCRKSSFCLFVLFFCQFHPMFHILIRWITMSTVAKLKVFIQNVHFPLKK